MELVLVHSQCAAAHFSRRDGVREAPKGYFAVGCLVIHASKEEHIADNMGVKVYQTFLEGKMEAPTRNYYIFILFGMFT